MLTDPAEGVLQEQLTAVYASVNSDEYLDADGVDFTYECNDDDLPGDIFSVITTLNHEPCDEDENANYPGVLLSGIPREKVLAHIEELRTMMSKATTPTLKRHYQEIITELTGGVLQLCKQAKLDFGPSEEKQKPSKKGKENQRGCTYRG